MVFDKYFMVIPVYRLPKEQYFSKMKEHFEKQISSSGSEQFLRSNPELLADRRINHRSSYGGEWEFNEIVGHIKLFFMGNQVRGEYWSTEPRKKVKTRRKKFEFKAHKLVPEIRIWDRTNDGILNAVEEYLSSCERELKGRYIDLREFEALKIHIDWFSLHKTKNIFA